MPTIVRQHHHLWLFAALVLSAAQLHLPAADELRYPPYLTTDAQREAWRIGWPQWHGPHSNGTAIDCGLKLVTAFKDMRLVWESKEIVPGWTPGRNYGVRNGFCTPVLSEGRVFVFYPWPHGFPLDRPDQNAVDRAELQKMTKEMPKQGDDVVVCFDALTGDLLWKRVWEKHGPTLFGSGKEGGHFTMCVRDGRVYAFGAGNWIYCVDAATGETVWEQNDQIGREGGPSNAAAIVADGVLIFHHRGHVVGYDAETGKQLWDIPGLTTGSRRSATNKIWRVDGRELVLHENTCIDPRSGTVLWDIPTGGGGNTTSVHGNHLVSAGTEDNVGVRGFRISPSGYELLWQLDGEKWEPSQFSTPTFYKGHAIMDLRAPEKIAGKDLRLWYIVAVELETGKVTEIEGLYKGWKYQPIIAEGLYYYFAGREFTVLDPDPATLRVLDNVIIKDHDGKRWTQDASPAYACGLMYIRTNNSVRCYDLRAK